MECLSSLVGPVYKAFCNKEYLCAAFVDIKGAFDSVHIPTLISCLASLQIPYSVCNFISSLFFQRFLQFSSPSGLILDRSTYRGLPQGSCLSPLLFNIYMSPICLSLASPEFQVLLYADDIVLFSSNKSLELSTLTLNNALKQLSISLNTAFFTIAPEKSHFMIFTRRQILAHPNIILDKQVIQPSSTVTYLGLKLDPKLRWVPHFQYLKGLISRWSNFLRATAGTHWGSHPSCLLKIFNAAIRSKADYGSFLYSSASHTHRKKLNSILTSCLRTTVGALSSSPLASLEVECACPPIELRSRRLAGKFLLKMLSSPNQSLFHMFVSIKSSWSYVPKTLPILASVASSFSAFSPLVHRPSLRLQIYDTPYAALLYVPEVTVSPNFLGYSPKELPRLSRTLVDSLFNEYISYNFRSSVQIFTDGSVSPNSAGFSFFIPSLNFSFSDKLHPLTSSFSAECYAIISALQFIFTLDFSSFLILSDSQSCLLAISSDSFLSSLSPLVLIIKSLIYRISLADKTVKFFWIPSHVGIAGNERADYLAFSTKSLIYFSPYKTPASDLLPFHRKLLRNAWQTKWDSLPPNHAAWHRQIVTSIPKHPWFKDLEISRHLIVSYTRLRIGHSLLPHHSSKLNLNSSPLCTLHHNESIWFALVFVVCTLFKDLKKDDLELNIVKKVTPQNTKYNYKLLFYYQFYYNFSKCIYYRYIGDFLEEDLETPRRRKLFWNTHTKMLDEKNQKKRLLEQKNRRLESKISTLPDVSTIRKWYSKLDGLPGMTKESFQAISLKVKEMKVNGKQLYGCLVMDEMSIKQHVHWTGTRHQGYIDFGLDAFVIMVVDINTSWKVPIAYYLINGISAEEKANIILNCLQELDTTGVIIKTLTFDGAANNLSMASELEANLQYSELKPYFLHPNTNDKKLPWRLEDINESGLHSATKLRNRHIYHFREKMKVRLVVQTFSTSVANAILFCMNDLKLDNFQGADATIEFCLSINNIFDILNTRNFLSKGTYNKSINKRTKTEIFHYIEESIDYLAGGFNALKNQQNVDHIEMLFSAIRAKGGFNNNPTVSQFEAAYKSIIVHSEIKSSSSANCMALDDTTILTVSSSNIKVKDTQSELLDLLCVAGTDDLENDNLVSVYQHSNFINDVVACIAGFVVRKIKKKQFYVIHVL
ncbi:hypothetical protein QTP88_018673 [Uroleucon formosanum]